MNAGKLTPIRGRNAFKMKFRSRDFKIKALDTDTTKQTLQSLSPRR